MPNFQGVWDLRTQFQYAGEWPKFAPDRGLFAAGYSDAVAGYKNIIDFINIGTLGNASDFGDLTNAPYQPGGCANTTRGIFAGGELGGDFSYARVNVIQYVTMGTEGNASDFGDLIQVNRGPAGSANDTRGLFSTGLTSSAVKLNVIQYITIASTGNATDFGDATEAVRYASALSSTTRSVRGGGQEGADSNNSNVMDYVTIASTGNATDFGDLSAAKSELAACSSSTRGLFGGGYTNTGLNVIEYITIGSTGNTTDFGDLLATRRQNASVSSKLRGIFAGGISETNVIEYVTIASTGNSQDFGDLTQSRYGLNIGNVAQSHGGIA